MAEKQTKYIFVTGGVVSGLGKGITAASLGRLLKCRGLKVASQKLDPYVNVDPGTMSPLQHGEVFVTDDGTETDLDLGHYERFIDENLNKYSNLTTGKVYWNVLNKERQGAYLGQTVQIIPHITNEIKSYIYNMASSTGADVVITEIGGTTGDIESQPFLEAIRQVGLEQGRDNCCFIHVVLVPYISGSNEYKSKPAQHSVKELQGMGVNPDIIILRADGTVGTDIRRKISTFCNVKPECVIENLTMPSLYQCPLMLHTNGLDDVVVEKLKLDVPPADLTEWKQVVSRIATRSKTCTIALVGKYVKLHDAYLSVMESLYHAGFENDSQVEIKWVESEDLTDQNACKEIFADVDGIIVPGGFGDRGIEGMIQAAQYARENNVPYFGICLGMQIMVMEFAPGCAGLRRRQFQRVHPGRQAQRHRPHGRPAGQHPQGRHHASGQVPLHRGPRHQDGRVLRPDRDLGAPPPPLRVQQRLPAGDAGRRSGHLRHQPGRPSGGDGGAARPRLPSGCPVPPGVQEPPQPRPSPVQGLHRGGAQVPHQCPAQPDAPVSQSQTSQCEFFRTGFFVGLFRAGRTI